MGFADRLRTELDGVHQPGRVGLAAWDLGERELVTIDADRVVHAASTIKVLIMIAALRRVRDGMLSLDTELELPEPGQRVGGFGVLRELTGLRRSTLGDLITLMVVISDNAATNAVIDAVGIDAINECGQDLGLTATRLERRLMDVHAAGRNVTTALEQAQVLDLLASGTALPEELTRYALGRLARQQVRDRLPALLPEDWTCWNKTGELLGLRHDVGLIGYGRPQATVAVLVDELVDETSASGYRGGPACEAIAAVGLAVRRALS